MKTLFIALTSLLLVQGIFADKMQCYKCEYSGKCEEEGTATDCVKPGSNCLYAENEESKKGKGCYADWTDKPDLSFISSFPSETKLTGCVDMTKKEDNKEAYKVCICNGDKCNTNGIMKSDMVKSVADKGERECYTCGDLAKGKECTKEELDEKKTTKCEENCFVVVAEKKKEGESISQTFRGCMAPNKEKTYGYGSISFENNNSKGDYYVCNKNKCNLDKDSWKASSVAGLTSSLALLFAGLVSYQLFN